MQSSGIPTKFAIPFAASAGSGYKRTIPQASQIGTQDGAASLTDGFPPLNFIPVGAGGVPPFGQDMNGILNQISSWCRWQASGGAPMYDATFAAAVGGYPVGAVVAATTAGGLWLCVVENNQSNPDQGGAGWIPIIRNLLAPTNYYVNAATGSDGNNGTSSATPFLTLQKACDQIPLYNLNGFSVTINVAAGNYTSIVLPKVNGSGSVLLVGDTATPTNCVITGTNKSAVTGQYVNGTYTISGFKVTASGSLAGDPICGISVSGGGTIFNVGNMNFGQCVGAGWAVTQGAVGGFTPLANVTISGGSSGNSFFGGDFMVAYGSAIIQSASTGGPNFNISNAVTYAGRFVESSFNSFVQVIYNALTNGGNVTGQRYYAQGNGVISVGGAAQTYYPGTVAGSPTTAGGNAGGQYF